MSVDFEKLHNEVYEWKRYSNVNRFGPRGHWEKKRQLTQTEWNDICLLLAKEDSGFFCQMTNTEFGFQLAMAIYADSPYPGVPPPCVFIVRPAIMPGYDDDNRKSDPNYRWMTMWNAFSVYTHSERNARILKHHGMEAPKDQVHYAY